MNWMDWKTQLKNRIACKADLPSGFALNEYEKAYFEEEHKEDFSFSVTPYYFSLINPYDPADPVRRQVLPDSRERSLKPYELADPLGEDKFSPVPGLVHRYKDRVLLHATSLCAVHCRHCFRRSFIQRKEPVITESALEAACRYIKNHSRVAEVLITGGDPLVLEDGALLPILEAVRSCSKQLTIRLGTRIPVVLPQRITKECAELLKAFRPLWIATHFNHPVEITPRSLAALDLLGAAGIPVVNQTVLLRGINDNPACLKTLFRSLVNAGVKPYYLLQGDLAPGTAHFRTPLDFAIRLYKRLTVELSGLVLPKLAVDAPGGGGKVALTGRLPVLNGAYKLRAPNRGTYWYPVEE